jgi:sterol-4alpha-carboxylate 3-dehydrogenase (decarboxylating)
MPDTITQALNTALPSIDLTTGQHRVPTSSARPLGPYVERPENADNIIAAFEGPYKPEQPVVRSRFDQLSDSAVKRSGGTDPLKVAGQVFFITNGEPVYFWDFPRRLWRMLAPDSYPARDPFVLPKSVGFAVATLAEWWGWLSGREPTFTRFRVTFTCVHRWHNIEKARRVLGYEPQVGLEEGMRRTVEVCARCRLSDPY